MQKSSFQNHPAGVHMIGQVSPGTKIGSEMTGENFSPLGEVKSLTAARKVLGSGQAIVRKSDLRIIAIKWLVI